MIDRFKEAYLGKEGVVGIVFNGETITVEIKSSKFKDILPRRFENTTVRTKVVGPSMTFPSYSFYKNGEVTW